MKRIFSVTFIVAVILMGYNCGPKYVTLSHESTMPTQPATLGPVQVAQVEDTRPDPQVLAEGVEVRPGTNSVAQEVRNIIIEALQNSGVQVGQTGPVIRARILKAELRYTYMHVQGTFIVQVQLVSPDGKVLWSQEIEGADGAGGPYRDLWTDGARAGLTALYRELVKAFSSPVFKQALSNTSGGISSSPQPSTTP